MVLSWQEGPVAAPPASPPAAGYFCGHQEQQVATSCCIRLGRCHLPLPGEWVPYSVTVTSWTSPCSAPPCPAREWLQEGTAPGRDWGTMWGGFGSHSSLSGTMACPHLAPRMLRAQSCPSVPPCHSHTTRPGCSHAQLCPSMALWHVPSGPLSPWGLRGAFFRVSRHSTPALSGAAAASGTAGWPVAPGQRGATCPGRQAHRGGTRSLRRLPEPDSCLISQAQGGRGMESFPGLPGPGRPHASCSAPGAARPRRPPGGP